PLGVPVKQRSQGSLQLFSVPEFAQPFWSQFRLAAAAGPGTGRRCDRNDRYVLRPHVCRRETGPLLCGETGVTVDPGVRRAVRRLLPRPGAFRVELTPDGGTQVTPRHRPVAPVEERQCGVLRIACLAHIVDGNKSNAIAAADPDLRLKDVLACAGHL